MSVVDANVYIHWLLGTGDLRHRATALLEREEVLSAPTLLFTEVLGRISGQTKAGGRDRLELDDAKLLIADFLDLGVTLHPPQPREDAGQLLALGANLSIADATYCQLAQRLDVPVYTFDRRMIDGATKLGPSWDDRIREP